jgi:hypothetical protein
MRSNAPRTIRRFWELLATDHLGPNLLRKSGAAEKIAFETGLVELTYANGVRLTLEGRADYSVIDLGTEFAMVARGNRKIELGVFDGEVELHLPGSAPFSLFKNQALVHGLDAQEPVHPVPLDRDKFVRAMPSRDFRWELDSLWRRGNGTLLYEHPAGDMIRPGRSS